MVDNSVLSMELKGRIHFVGVAGSGMAPLAIYTAQKSGTRVSGSDRCFDQARYAAKQRKLAQFGISIYPQDGRGVNRNTDLVIFSGAVESAIADIQRARSYGIPIIGRSQLLAYLANKKRSIAISGTSGKTTVTAMCASIFTSSQKGADVICGGSLRSSEEAAATMGVIVNASERFIFEADESDGSLTLYKPHIGVLLNISLDHKPMEELTDIFRRFIGNCHHTLIYNETLKQFVAEAEAMYPSHRETVSFGFSKSATVCPQALELGKWGSTFKVQDTTFSLSVPGKHNVINALAAIAIGLSSDIPLSQISEALARFKGVGRRLEVIGEAMGVTVVDDFAHNPHKIRASMHTLRHAFNRLFVIYQPHGFGPTSFLKDHLVRAFADSLRQDDRLTLLPIYYAGGTVSRTISSADLAASLEEQGVTVRTETVRKKLIPLICGWSRPGDAVVIMGARDDSLNQFARHILEAIAYQENP